MSYNLEVNVIVTLLVSLVFLQKPYIKRYQITYWSDARVSTNFWPCGIFSIKTTDPLSSVHLFLPFLFFWVIKPLCLSAHLFMLKLLFQFSSPLSNISHPSPPPHLSPSLSHYHCFIALALTGDYYSRSYCTTTWKAFTTSSISSRL